MKNQLAIMSIILGFTIANLVSCRPEIEWSQTGNTENEVVSGFITENTTWYNEVIYELKGRVVVREGATLTIEAGAIIKGQEGTGTSASVLIVERGAKIDAQGTVANPIIFTSVLDNIALGETAGTNLNETQNSLWGGIIILGKAPVSSEDGNTEGQIEGVPANETYGTYGGNDVADNSGTLTYISIRHGGISIGDGNEINGLTLGGVGTGTTIDFVEIVANLDDGVEFFGGTVNADNIIVVYQGDDAIDIDQNYSGTINNVMVITGDGIGTDEALEIDGPEGATYTDGLFTITNGTFINEGTEGSGADFKSKAQGNITNCVWDGYATGIKIRASFSDTIPCTDKTDSYTHLVTDNTLNFSDIELVSTTVTASDIANVYTGSCEDCGCVTATMQADTDTEIGASVVTSASTGATPAAFSGWTWADEKGKL
ncbi:MAG: hypothetical protein ACPG4Z_03520 [Chitinophagales bacterium]